MKSSYKLLGPYIREIDNRNASGKEENLLGVSTNKVFIPSVANTVGTDFCGYKVVTRNQFTYVPDTSRRGDRIGIGLLEDFDEAIVSSAYTVFEIIDHTKLLPQYLMMWFRRPEFDRYARFMSHGSVREIFGWEEMSKVELPVPAIEKQKEIVKEYHTIVNRINLNEQLNRKLEETAQAIYKQWFVDFEFPNEEGKPYKSSGGEMVESELGEIPKCWDGVKLGNLLSKKGYIRGPFGSALLKDDMMKEGMPVYEQQHAIYGHRDFRYYVTTNKFEQLKRFSVQYGDLIISCSGTLGRISLIRNDNHQGIINQALLILRPNLDMIHPVLLKQLLNSPAGQQSLIENSGGSAQVNIAKRELIEGIFFLLPPSETRKKVERILIAVDSKMEGIRIETEKLLVFGDILLSRLTRTN